MQRNLSGLNVAVLGGGITGLTAAFYLLRSGARVTIFEAQDRPGGLATTFNFGDFWWDKFYHCILTSDAPLLQLVDDLGLTAELRWTATKVGFFADERLYSMTSSADFLKFPPLNIWDKARLGAGILYVSRIRDGRKLEAYPVSNWLRKVFGAKNYEKMWGPLLKCKLGGCREEASAAFIWATIARLYSTREKNSSQQERLGYVRGGYRTVFNRLVERVEEMGGQIVTGTAVQTLSSAETGLDVTVGDRRQRFDSVVATVPSPVVAKIAPELSKSYVEKLTKVKYLGIVCFALVLNRQLSPYYVTNLADEGFPFTGIIEMTNLVSREETAGRHLVYLPKYTAPNDPLFNASEDEIWRQFLPAVQRVIPDFKESDVERRFLFRERFVQPVPVLNYSELVPDMQTSINGLILANTTQIINSTLNNNAMVKIARQAVDLAGQCLQAQTEVSVAQHA